MPRATLLSVLFACAALFAFGCGGGVQVYNCATNQDCPSDMVCNPATQQCVEKGSIDVCDYCRDDEFCENDECKPCYPNCESDANCFFDIGQVCNVMAGICEGPPPPACTGVDGDPTDGDADGDVADGDQGGTVTEGGACTLNTECVSGLVCFSGACRASCDPFAVTPCAAADRRCHFVTAGELQCTGVCAPSSGGQALGAECNAVMNLCEVDLVCDSGICKKLCSLAAPTQCQSGDQCSVFNETCNQVGLCGPKTCTIDSECGAGYRCRNGACVPSTGGCASDTECQDKDVCNCDGLCVAGCEEAGCSISEGICNRYTHHCEFCDPLCQRGESCNFDGTRYFCGQPCPTPCCQGQICGGTSCVARPTQCPSSCGTPPECYTCGQSTGFICKQIPNCSAPDGDGSEGDTEQDYDYRSNPVCIPAGQPCAAAGAACCETAACLMGTCVIL